MNLDNLTFDNFMSLDSKTRKEVINSYEYLKIMLKKNMKESRYAHSLSVADTAKQLAKRHNVDPEKAYLAGLLHDCTKDFDEAFHDEYLKYYDETKLKMPEGVKHSYTAKYYLKEKLNFHDKDILNAIYNHTICESRDKLSLIIYIADKREPLRKINDDILELAYKDLYKAYNLLHINVERYIKEVKNERFIEDSL